MDRGVGAAAGLPGSDRKDLAIEALAGSATVSDLAARHEVSRKFVYQQTHKTRAALDDAFSSATPDDEVLFELTVTKAWLHQVIVGLTLICRSSYRGVVEFLRDLLGVPVSLGCVDDVLQSATRQASAINHDQDLSRIRVGLHDEIFQGATPVLAGGGSEALGNVRNRPPQLRMPILPFKLNQNRRHHIPRQRRQVTNWPAYDASLRQRGSLTVWFTDEAVAAWAAEPRTTCGGQPWYSPLAILTALTIRAVFRLAYRQAEGLLGSVIGLLGLALPVPDHTTLSRHAATLEVPRPGHADAGTGSEPMYLLVDSTGLKLCGKGEWLLEKHGSGRGRSQPSPFSRPG